MTTATPNASTGSEQATRHQTRRALVVGALGGLVAWAAGALGRAAPARATDGDIIHVGDSLTATNATRLTNSTNTIPVFQVQSTSGNAISGTSDSYDGVIGSTTSGNGVTGLTDSGSAVYGQANTTGYGVRAYSIQSTAIQGYSDGTGKPAMVGWSGTDSTAVLGFSDNGNGSLPAAKAKTGVYGHATQDAASRGVWGHSTAGQGVRGEATSGSGVYGYATTGFALRASGRLRFDKVSGVATIATGNTAVTVTPGVDLTTGSFVLLTPQTSLGGRDLWFTTNVNTNALTIHISSARASATKVCWLLLG